MRKRRGSPCQVGTGKANASEPLRTRRDEEMASKPGYPNNPGIKPGGCPPIGQAGPGVKVARARSAASAWNVGRQTSTPPRSRLRFPGRGERERINRREPEDVEYRRGVCWRTGS